MKRVKMGAVLLSLWGLFWASESFAQPAKEMKWRGSGGWGRGTPYNLMYNPDSLEIISGKVIRVDRIVPLKGMSYGVHLVLKNDRETISVVLGPAWFIENQDVRIKPGDSVEVIGSRITYEGNLVIMAAEVKKGDETLKLRDTNGIPVWSGWRRH